MRKLIFISFLISALGLGAQTGKVLDARNSVATNDIKNAKILIDEAGKSGDFASDPHYYYWRGYIYKELYKVQDKGKNTVSQLRDESTNSFYKVLEYKSRISGDTITHALKIMTYLSQTYFNDAVTSLDTVHYEIAIENYDKFRKLAKAIDPQVNLSNRDIKFKMKLATKYVSLYEVRSGQPSGDVFFEKAKKEYAEIIRMDQTNLTANYNLGIHFYNRAVNIIKDLDVETSLEELAEKEDVCVDLFLKALPYVKTAYDIDPLRRETLIGLTGIYWSLNDLEKYDFYKLKLKELE
jgi:tetratricopeptide (TPR) repeat protein